MSNAAAIFFPRFCCNKKKTCKTLQHWSWEKGWNFEENGRIELFKFVYCNDNLLFTLQGQYLYKCKYQKNYFLILQPTAVFGD